MAPQVQSIQPLATLADLLQHIKTVDTRSTFFVAFLENNAGQDQWDVIWLRLSLVVNRAPLGQWCLVSVAGRATDFTSG
jgi:hypothetical protein